MDSLSNLSQSDILWVALGGLLAGAAGMAKCHAWTHAVAAFRWAVDRLWPCDSLTLERLDSDAEINDRIIALRANAHCWRAQFWQFHNGGKFRKDRPKFKFTLTHEAVAPGQSSQLGLQHNSDVHVSFSPGFLASVYLSDRQGNIYIRCQKGSACALCPNPECRAHYVIVEGMSDPFLQTLFRRHGAGVVVYAPVMDVRKNNGNPIGFIALHFGKASVYQDIASTVDKALCDATKEVGFILGSKGKGVAA